MTAALLWVRHTEPGAGSRVGRAVLWVMLAAMLLGLAVCPTLAADEQASRFVWDEVSVTVRLQDDGSLHIREHDRVQFTGGPFRQGFREIPLAYIGGISQVTVAEVGSGPAQPYTYVVPGSFLRTTPHTYTFRRVGTDMRIEWSFPPTMTAKRSFVIEYIARGALQVYNDAVPPYQAISWVGVDRALTADAPVNRATLIIILPRPVDPAATAARSNGTPFGSSDGQTWFWRAEKLGAGESLEAALQFPPLVQASKPAWQDTRDRQISRETSANLAFLGLALLTAVGGGVGLLAAWWTRGRDPVVGPTPEYLTAPPYDTPPGVVGALLDERVDQREYVATLIDLAGRGVVRVTEQVQPAVSAERRMSVTLLKPDARLAPFETSLLAALFAHTWWREAQAHLPLEGRAGVQEALEQVERGISSELVQRGYFTARPARTRAGWRIGGFGLWLLAGIMLVVGINASSVTIPVFVASIVLAGLGGAVYVVSQHMPQKTRAGAEAAARWRAFRRYMETIDSVGQLDGERDGFERYLPYAIVFGIERTWITAFARADAASPQWYDVVNLDGNWINSAWRAGARAPLSNLDLPDLEGLQEMSDLAASSLQSSSDALFDLFNEAGAAFNPAEVARQVASDPEIAMKIGVTVLRIALGGRGSGGGRGGFS